MEHGAFVDTAITEELHQAIFCTALPDVCVESPALLCGASEAGAGFRLQACDAIFDKSGLRRNAAFPGARGASKANPRPTRGP